MLNGEHGSTAGAGRADILSLIIAVISNLERFTAVHIVITAEYLPDKEGFIKCLNDMDSHEAIVSRKHCRLEREPIVGPCNVNFPRRRKERIL
jgi:hypothetical protein